MNRFLDESDDFENVDDPNVRDRLIERHLPLARYFAQRFANRGEPLEDLVQVASLALVKSIDAFDPTRDVKFSTYAATMIIGGLKRHFRDTTWALRVPRRTQERVRLVRAVTEDLRSNLKRAPTIEEIAKEAALEPDDVIEAINAAAAYSTGSLDKPDPDNKEFQAPAAEGAAAAYSAVEDRTLLATATDSLGEREKYIIYLRYYKELSQADIAKELGISQMHVSRLIKRSLEAMKKEIK